MNQLFDGYVRSCNLCYKDIVPMKESPFKVRDDDEMEKLIDSIKNFGVLTPIIVRKLPEVAGESEKYEIISGHRRFEACRRLGYTHIPARIMLMLKEASIIAMVDSNLCHRSEILPSEKAAAYKLRLEAMKKQGYRSDLYEESTSDQVGQKSDTSVQKLADECPDSKTQIQRFIRLNELEKPLLDMVDEGKISLTPAVELSYLSKEEQNNLIETISSEESTPSLAQAQRMRKYSENGELDMDRILSILTEVKGNQKESVSIPTESFKKYLKSDTTPKATKDFVMKAIDYYCRHLDRLKEQER